MITFLMCIIWRQVEHAGVLGHHRNVFCCRNVNRDFRRRCEFFCVFIQAPPMETPEAKWLFDKIFIQASPMETLLNLVPFLDPNCVIKEKSDVGLDNRIAVIAVIAEAKKSFICNSLFLVGLCIAFGCSTIRCYALKKK